MDRRLRRSEGGESCMPCLTARFTGRWLAGRSAGGVLRERAYGQNDVLQPYDLPVTRGECVRALGC